MTTMYHLDSHSIMLFQRNYHKYFPDFATKVRDVMSSITERAIIGEIIATANHKTTKDDKRKVVIDMYVLCLRLGDEDLTTIGITSSFNTEW